MKKGIDVRDMMAIPLTVPYAAVIFGLLLFAGFQPLYALTVRFISLPMHIYLLEMPLAATVVWQQRRELRSPGFLVGLVIWLCLNVLLYVGLGRFIH